MRRLLRLEPVWQKMNRLQLSQIGSISRLFSLNSSLFASNNRKMALDLDHFRFVPFLPDRFLWLLALPLLIGGCAQQDALSISLQDSDGRWHHSKEQRGQWLVINFWATWCPPCRKELPALNELHRDYAQTTVWGINQENIDTNKLGDFLKQHPVDFPLFLKQDNTEKLLQQLSIRGVPTTYLINPQGEVAKRYEGEIQLAELQAFMQLPVKQTETP